MQIAQIQLDQDTQLTVVTFTDADLAEPKPVPASEVVSVN